LSAPVKELFVGTNKGIVCRHIGKIYLLAHWKDLFVGTLEGLVCWHIGRTCLSAQIDMSAFNKIISRIEQKKAQYETKKQEL
jgi:hypothetical protein